MIGLLDGQPTAADVAPLLRALGAQPLMFSRRPALRPGAVAAETLRGRTMKAPFGRLVADRAPTATALHAALAQLFDQAAQMRVRNGAPEALLALDP